MLVMNSTALCLFGDRKWSIFYAVTKELQLKKQIPPFSIYWNMPYLESKRDYDICNASLENSLSQSSIPSYCDSEFSRGGVYYSFGI